MRPGRAPVRPNSKSLGWEAGERAARVRRLNAVENSLPRRFEIRKALAAPRRGEESAFKLRSTDQRGRARRRTPRRRGKDLAPQKEGTRHRRGDGPG